MKLRIPLRSPLCALWILSALYSGCANNATNPQESELLQLEDIKNLIWSRSKPGSAPFYLIYDDANFFGDDGCNSFGGEYQARGDSVFPGGLSQTLLICDISTLSAIHLSKPYHMRATQNELRLYTEEGMITYASEVTAPVANSPVLGKWQLRASTDPEFEELQRQQLLPTLSLDGERGFKIEWRCSPDNAFGCNQISGLFGLDAREKILLYKKGISAHGQGGLSFMAGILYASTYTVAADTLTLFNEKTETKYFFADKALE